MHPIPICPASDDFFENYTLEFSIPRFQHFSKFDQQMVQFCNFDNYHVSSLQIHKKLSVDQQMGFSYSMSNSKFLQSFFALCPAPSTQKKFIGHGLGLIVV